MSNDAIILRRWMVGAIAGIIGMTVVAMQWIAEVENNVEDIPQMQRDISTALQVLADHGTELQGIRNLHSEFLGTLNGLRQDMEKRTQNRYTSEDAQKEWQLHRREHNFETNGRASP